MSVYVYQKKTGVEKDGVQAVSYNNLTEFKKGLNILWSSEPDRIWNSDLFMALSWKVSHTWNSFMHLMMCLLSLLSLKSSWQKATCLPSRREKVSRAPSLTISLLAWRNLQSDADKPETHDLAQLEDITKTGRSGFSIQNPSLHSYWPQWRWREALETAEHAKWSTLVPPLLMLLLARLCLENFVI